MENCNPNNKFQDKLLKKFYAGGIQRYFPRNEAQVYKSTFTLDVSNYCLKDFSSNDLTESEINCVNRLAQKNNEFFNLN